MRRKIIIEIKSSSLKMIYEIHEMKEIISKKKCNNNTLPKHWIVYKI